MRADQLLVQQGHAPSRSAAARLIERGAVRWLSPTGWAVPRKAGEDLPVGCEIEVTDDAELRWVSRAGLKLEAALARTLTAVRRYSAVPIAIQLAHAGRKASSAVPWEGGQLIPPERGGWQTVAPSALPHAPCAWG